MPHDKCGKSRLCCHRHSHLALGIGGIPIFSVVNGVLPSLARCEKSIPCGAPVRVFFFVYGICLKNAIRRNISNSDLTRYKTRLASFWLRRINLEFVRASSSPYGTVGSRDPPY